MKPAKLFIAFIILWAGVPSSASAADAFSGYYGTPQTKANIPARDPFTNSPKMYNEIGIQTLQKTSEASQANYNYDPSALGIGATPLTVTLPKMRLKGLVSKPNQKPAALLELEGMGVYYVTAGEEIGLGQGGVLKVIGVNEHGVKVQAPLTNQVIVVR